MLEFALIIFFIMIAVFFGSIIVIALIELKNMALRPAVWIASTIIGIMSLFLILTMYPVGPVQNEIKCQIGNVHDETHSSGKSTTTRMYIGLVCGEKLTSIRFDYGTPQLLDGKEFVYKQYFYRGIFGLTDYRFVIKK